MLKARPTANIFCKSLGLSLVYALFWVLLHFFLTDSHTELAWFVPQLLSSALIFFTFNGLFATFDYYRFGFLPQIMVASFYIHPFFQLFYFQTYKSFMEQQNISLLLREPFFLLKVFCSEMTWGKAVVLFSGVALVWWVNRLILSRPDLTRRQFKPYDFFINRWVMAFMWLLIILQIKWCFDHDLSQLAMRPFYPIVFVAMLSIFVHLFRTDASFWQKGFVAVLIFANAGQLYALNLGFLNERSRFTLDQQYYRALFGAFFRASGLRGYAAG